MLKILVVLASILISSQAKAFQSMDCTFAGIALTSVELNISMGEKKQASYYLFEDYRDKPRLYKFFLQSVDEFYKDPDAFKQKTLWTGKWIDKCNKLALEEVNS